MRRPVRQRMAARSNAVRCGAMLGVAAHGKDTFLTSRLRSMAVISNDRLCHASLCRATLCMARRSLVWRSCARPGHAWNGKDTLSILTLLGVAMNGHAWLCTAMRRTARPGDARRGLFVNFYIDLVMHCRAKRRTAVHGKDALSISRSCAA